MAYSLNFTYSITADADDLTQCGVKLLGEITSYTDFPDPGVFVFLINPVTHVQEWSHVASPCDYQNWNYQVPGLENFVRQKSFVLRYASASLADEALVTIQADLLRLCNNFSLSDQMGTPVTVVITETV